MQYAHTHTDQKSDSYLSDESQTRYVLGRMQYAPTHTDQKFDSYLSDESQTRYIFGCMFLHLTYLRQETTKICMITYEIRRELGGCDQCHANLDEQLLKFVWARAKPAENWTNIAIFTENPPRIGRIWPYSPKTRRGWDEYGHIYRKPGGNGMNMATAIENSPRMG